MAWPASDFDDVGFFAGGGCEVKGYYFSFKLGGMVLVVCVGRGGLFFSFSPPLWLIGFKGDAGN